MKNYFLLNLLFFLGVSSFGCKKMNTTSLKKNNEVLSEPVSSNGQYVPNVPSPEGSHGVEDQPIVTSNSPSPTGEPQSPAEPETSIPVAPQPGPIKNDGPSRWEGDVSQLDEKQKKYLDFTVAHLRRSGNITEGINVVGEITLTHTEEAGKMHKLAFKTSDGRLHVVTLYESLSGDLQFLTDKYIFTKGPA